MQKTESFAFNAPIIGIVLLTVATVFLYRETVVSLLQLWTNSENATYSHGLLLLAACVFLCYRRSKQATEQIRPQPTMVGFLLLLLTSLAWFIAGQKHLQILQQMTLVLLPVFMLLAISGYRITRLLSFPVLSITFAVPVWDSLTPFLQTLTAHGVTLLLNVTGIPSVLEGKFILIPAGTFDVAPSCSGLRQFVVSTMIVGLYSYARRLRWQSASLLVLMAILLSIIANILRVYIVVVAGQLTEMRHSFVTDHSNLGKVVFFMWMFPFILLANKFVQAPRTNCNSVTPSDIMQHAKPRDTNSKSLALRTTLMVLVTIAVGPTLSYYYRAHSGNASLFPADVPSQVNLLPEACESCRTTVGRIYKPKLNLSRVPSLRHPSLELHEQLTIRNGRKRYAS